MKRCPNCGFSNTESSNTCEKCDVSLINQSKPDNSIFEGKKTKLGVNEGLSSWDESNVSNTPITNSNEINCKKCDYTLMSNTTICPSCGTDNGRANNNIIKQDNKQAAIGGTARISDFFVGGGSVPKFQLVSEREGKIIEFEGEEVILNRAMLDKNNNTISSNAHTKIENINGAWHITDESSNKATFIQVSDKTPINDNTIILIGNQFYRFKITE